ncbi:MAG: PAS domain S-box protein, partial [Methanosarcina sp.]
GKVLVAVAWQEICTKFHRKHPECAAECIKSDKYILSHLAEANPTVSYVCPHGLTDNATPLIIDGKHLGNFFTGQFFMEKPDIDFFRRQAKKYGFNEQEYLRAVRNVPVWNKDRLMKNLEVIKGLIELVADLGLRNLKDKQFRAQLLEIEKKYNALFEKAPDGFHSQELNELIPDSNHKWLETLGYSKDEVTRKIFENYARIAAAESNQFNHFIIDTVEQGIIVYDTGLRYKVWNTTMEKITGIPSENVLGKLPAEVFPFLEEDGVMDGLRSALAGHPAATLKIHYNIPETGKTGWAEDKSMPLKDLNGNIIGVLGTVNDITIKVVTGLELESAKEKSRIQEKQFQEFFDNAADPILIAEMASGIIVAANNAAAKLLKKPFDKIIGMHQKALHPEYLQPQSIEEFFQHSEEINAGDGTSPIENIVVCSDGEEIPVEILSAEVTYQGKRCIMGTFRDITVRKEKEAELKRALERLNFHLENTPLGVIEFNNRKEIIRWSANSEKIFGWSESEALGKTVEELNLIYDEDKQDFQLVSDQMFYGRKTNSSLVFRNYHKHGSILSCEWYNSAMVNENGSLESFHTLVHNITERIILEEKLKNSHNLMQYVIEHNRGAVAIHDKDLNYVYVSQRYLTDYKINEKDIIGRNHYDVFPDIPQKWRDVHQKALMGVISSAEDDAWPREDGTTDWTRWECRPWYESDGSIGGIIIYIEVINKLKETEQALIKAKEKAEESDRLKTAFLRNMSHEVRTPLNSIVGFSQILAEKVCSMQKKKEYSDMIMKSSEKLLDIISNVTEMALMQSSQIDLNLSEFDLIPLVNEVAASFESMAIMKNDRISVVQEDQFTGSVIESDRLILKKIFRHLIDNAVKFTDSGSIKIIYGIIDCSLHFSVTDTGIGINKEICRYLFEPFSKAKETLTSNSSGVGLGLALVKEYLRLLKGTIKIESEPGQGTTTKVLIPIKSVSGKNQLLIHEIKRENKVRLPKIIKGKTILIAEDEIMNFLYLKELLNCKSNNIIHAKNGKMAVEACIEHLEIDLVLMDLKMPLMDGETAAIQIKKLRPQLPIIAQTAYALEEIKNRSAWIFDDYLIKPIDLATLKEKVEKLIKE